MDTLSCETETIRATRCDAALPTDVATNQSNQMRTPEERNAKRHLAKLLKLQSRIRKLENQLALSASRHDAALAR
jgi:hypothetical protein